MKTLHYTPGKWVAGCDDDDCSDANVILADGVVIAHVVDAPEIRERHNKGKIEGPGCSAGADALDEVDANAKLMAMAPDLYATAVKFVEAFSGNKASQLGNGMAFWTYEAFKKLIERNL